MAWRLSHLVLAGELDNTTFGWTIGWLELEGFDQPLRFKWLGNCHPDLAGWRLRIHRVEPELPPEDDEDEPPRTYEHIDLDQSGHVGGITADQMVKHFELPVDEVARQLMEGKRPPFTWRKCFYLEWFSNTNGRAVVQSTCLAVERIGQRRFELTEQQWREQASQNAEQMGYFMTQIGDALESPESGEDE